MRVIDLGHKEWITTKEAQIMLDSWYDIRYICKCGHSVYIPCYVDKLICSHCGRYVFREKKEEFKYRLKEVILSDRR